MEQGRERIHSLVEERLGTEVTQAGIAGRSLSDPASVVLDRVDEEIARSDSLVGAVAAAPRRFAAPQTPHGRS